MNPSLEQLILHQSAR